MAKKKKEEVVEKATEQPKVDDTVEKIKVKKKPTMKKISQDDEPIKVDLSKQPKTDEVVEADVSKTKQDVDEQVKEEKPIEEVKKEVTSETPVLEEITDEVEEKIEEVKEKVEQIIDQSEKTGEPLPENVQKLMKFMDETGGDLEDYVKLNQDYSKLDNQSLLHEYYKKTKPHLSSEEIDFLMEDNFSYDEETDEERNIKRKKLALKEQVADAKSHLDGLKSKYYEDIKSGTKLTQEQQEAINFYHEVQEQQKQDEKIKTNFLNKTNKFFGDKFKGFEYNVGERKFRFNVSDAENVKNTQVDIGNFIGKFLDENQQMKDEAGYHKSLYTAMNADTIANHFYEQGRADAMKDSVAKAKNINMNPRQEMNENIDTGNVKVKVLGDDGPDFKFKIKQK